MAKIPYEGSLVDDINLVNQEEKKSRLSGDKTLIFVLLFDIVIGAIGMRAGISVPISAGILTFCNTGILTFARNTEKKIKEFNESRLKASENINSLITTLSKANENTNNLVATVDYDSIKDAVIVTDTTQEEIPDEMKVFNNELMNELVDVVTSKIYYLNSDNKISILQEVKKTLTNNDHNSLIKVVDSRKPSCYVKQTTLESLEDDDKNLPVKVVLELK